MSFLLPKNVRLATVKDVPELRRHVNESYRELAEMGLNFTGTYQDEKITAERMQNSEVYLLHVDQQLVASMNLSIRKDGKCAYINQLAIRPDQKRKGIGSFLMELVEKRAIY